MKNLHLYKKNIYSQNGEDGVILEIIDRIFPKKKNLNVVEFGAHDGKYCSNTYNLILNKLVKTAVYIEAEEKYFNSLIELSKKHKEIIPINAHISFKENSEFTLDKILKKKNFDINFDILSIDIDSYDLDVFRSIQIYSPKLIIIEAGRQNYGVLSEHSIDKNLNSFSSIHNEFKKNFYLIFFNGNCFYLNKKHFDENLIKLNFDLNDKLHYYLHQIYANYDDKNLIKKIIWRLIPKNIIILDLVMWLQNKLLWTFRNIKSIIK